ncbi:LysR family transcriptional regulator [Rhizohabitans arisaemae]|uniref:LysR family transcriptional regulator n=1 Tax=Rhizohabitans arisaemae TaxID=2720610 RepID=UPI0024B0A327|nr:LysR family transcriptional regulator [Rhizohabitans arisaemae]
MELEVRHLRAICAVAESGSISKAAVALKMSQPALAAQLGRIERMLGGRLFDRGRDGVHPTPFGDWVLIRAQSLLPAFDEFLRDAGRYARQGEARTQIRMGCAATRLAGYVTTALRDLLPDAEVTVRTEEVMDILPELLESGRLEIATLGDYPGHELSPPEGVVYAVVAHEPIFVAMAATHPLAEREEVELRDLAAAEWALPPLVESRHREYFWETCREYGFSPNIAYSVSFAVVLDLIAAGRCIAMFQATHREHPGIALRPLAGSPLRFRHVMGWREGSPIAKHAADLVREAMRVYWTEALRAPVHLSWLKRHGPLPQPPGAYAALRMLREI